MFLPLMKSSHGGTYKADSKTSLSLVMIRYSAPSHVYFLSGTEKKNLGGGRNYAENISNPLHPYKNGISLR